MTFDEDFFDVICVRLFDRYKGLTQFLKSNSTMCRCAQCGPGDNIADLSPGSGSGGSGSNRGSLSDYDLAGAGFKAAPADHTVGHNYTKHLFLYYLEWLFIICMAFNFISD